MTPKEKAQELVDKMYYSGRYLDSENYIPLQALWRTKQCALIAVDEILKANHIWYEDSIPYKYWIKVKKEIENL